MQKSHMEAPDDGSRQSDTLTDEEARELDYLDDHETLSPQEDLPFRRKLKRVSLKR